MLALEGERADSLPLSGSLAQALGARFGASKAVVMQRYKAVYDIVEECIRDVPWLEGHEWKGKGRSKVAKRVVVARGLKDVVQFQDEIWMKKFEGVERPVLDIEEDGEDGAEDDTGSVASGSTGGTSTASIQSVMSRGDGFPRLQRKKRRPAHVREVEQASQFLLNPLASPSSSTRQRAEHGTRQDLLEHLLTADTPSLSDAFRHPPTRLQLLATSRGGGEDDKIADEELFDDGELDALLRDPGEVEVMRAAMKWDEEAPPSQTSEAAPDCRKRKRRPSDGDKDPRNTTVRTTKRIDMGALARLLDPNTHLDEDVLEGYPIEGKEDDEFSAPFALSPDAEEVIEDWRPLSPSPGAFDEDRYDT